MCLKYASRRSSSNQFLFRVYKTHLRLQVLFVWRRQRDFHPTGSFAVPKILSLRLKILTAATHSARFITHRVRSLISLPPVPGARVQINLFRVYKKHLRLQVLFVWRRQRDLNSRAGNSRPTPLAGAPLRPTWVCLRIKNGGENRIRTYGTFRYHWFSRPAP